MSGLRTEPDSPDDLDSSSLSESPDPPALPNRLTRRRAVTALVLTFVVIVSLAALGAVIVLARFENPLAVGSGSRGVTSTHESWIVGSVLASTPVIVSGDVPDSEITVSRPIVNDSPFAIEIVDPHPGLQERAYGNCMWMPVQFVFFEQDQAIVDASPATLTPPFELGVDEQVFVEVTGVFHHGGVDPCFWGDGPAGTTDHGGGSIQDARVEMPYRVFGVDKTAVVDLGLKIAYFRSPEVAIEPEITHRLPTPSP